MDAKPRLLVDINVGRLAKWLRVMGYDMLLSKEKADNELVSIAIREEPVVRDAEIVGLRAVRPGEMAVVRIEKDDLRS